MSDKCDFIIYPTYFSKEITTEIIVEIIDRGFTSIYFDFKDKDNVNFTAYLKIIDGVLKPQFPEHYLPTKCPLCGGKILVLTSGYSCENNFENDNDSKIPKCNVYIPSNVAGVLITDKIAESLLNGFHSDFMIFTKKPSESFTCRLQLLNGRVVFDNFVCLCPKCGGNIISGKKAYNCTNRLNPEVKCDFVIWNEISGRSISPDEVVSLCANKTTIILDGFYYRNKVSAFSGKLIINDQFKIKLI